ncbi:MAG: GIY-YIG nuclease family protein [Burkholderiales bacterium]|nr:GIY-YIG nuclease family protein [Burkholderiales bacterium]
MPAGSVYVLSNPSLRDGLLKVGKTTGTVENRARGLRGTGVPTHFKVEHSVHVTDCGLVETVVHRRLAPYRYAADREFFEAPLALVVSVLDQVVGETKERGAAKALEREWEAVVRQVAANGRADQQSRLAAFEMRVDRCSETIQGIYRTLRDAVEGWPDVTFLVHSKTDGIYFKRRGRNFFTLHPKHSASPDNIGISFWHLERAEIRAMTGLETRDHLKQKDGVWLKLHDGSSNAAVIACARRAYERAGG